MRDRIWAPLTSYGVAVAAVATALTFRIWPRPEPSPFPLFYVAVMVSAWAGGLGPGLLATALSAVACDFYFLPPHGAFATRLDDLLRLSVFILSAGLISSLAAARRRAKAAESRQRSWLERTLASIGDAVIATDPAGRVTFLNGVARSLTGRSPAPAVGSPLPKVFPILDGRTREPAECPAARALREGVAVELGNQAELDVGDGRTILIDGGAAPIRDARGRLLGVVVVFRDVTGRRRAEEAIVRARDELERRVGERTAELSALNLRLDSERAHLMAVLRHMPAGVLIAEAPSGRLLQCNDEAARLLRRELAPSETVHGATRFGAVHPDGRPYRPEEYPIARSLLGGEVIQAADLCYRHADASVPS